MVSPINALILNESTNKNFVLTKEEHYKFLFNLMPQCRRQRINYIKKNKEKVEKVEENKNIPVLARIKESSQREIRNNIEMHKYLYEL